MLFFYIWDADCGDWNVSGEALEGSRPGSACVLIAIASERGVRGVCRSKAACRLGRGDTKTSVFLRKDLTNRLDLFIISHLFLYLYEYIFSLMLLIL